MRRLGRGGGDNTTYVCRQCNDNDAKSGVEGSHPYNKGKKDGEGESRGRCSRGKRSNDSLSRDGKGLGKEKGGSNE